MDTAGTVSDRVAGAAVSAHQTAVDSMASVQDKVQSGLDSARPSSTRDASRPVRSPTT